MLQHVSIQKKKTKELTLTPYVSQLSFTIIFIFFLLTFRNEGMTATERYQ